MSEVEEIGVASAQAPSAAQISSVITYDTSSEAGRQALDRCLRRLGSDGRELLQAEEGLRMALDQRRRAMNDHPVFRANKLAASRAVLSGAVKRLRRARAVFAPIPVLEPITIQVRQLDPAIWGDAVVSHLHAAE